MDYLHIPVIILHLSIIAKNILLQRSHNYGVWNYWQQKLLNCICYTMWIDWHMIFGLKQEGGSMIAPMALAHPLYPIDNRSRNRNRNLWVGWCVSSWWPLFPSRSSVLIYIDIYALLYEFCFLWFTNCVLLSDDNSLIPGCLWLLAFVLNNTLLPGIWCSTIPHLPGCFCPWTFFQNIGFNMVPLDPFMSPSYSTWIFCRGVSGFVTDCPCDIWCRVLTTCLLRVCPPFRNRFLNTSWAVGLTYWIVYLHFCLFFDICKYICLDTYHFLALSLLLKYSLIFSSTPVLTSSIDVVFVLSILMR